MKNNDQFTVEWIKEIYQKILDSGVPLYLMHDLSYVKDSVGLLIRHDFDSDMESAKYIDDLEYELNIKASYYFLQTSDFYNVRSKKNRLIINNILRNGSEVGLHFDEEQYKYKVNYIKGIDYYLRHRTRWYRNGLYCRLQLFRLLHGPILDRRHYIPRV